MEKINNIQVLRAYSALIVVFFHAVGLTSAYGHDVQGLSWFRTLGISGVDVFFVISGFVMVYTQTLNPKSATEFWTRRLIRVAPLYWSLTIVWVSFLYMFPHLFTESVFDVDHAAASLLFSSQLIGRDWPVMGQGWTLEIEMLFYIIFGAAIIFRYKFVFLGSSCSLFILMYFGFTNMIVAEFIIGMVIGHLYMSRVFLKHSKYVFMTGIALMSISAVWASDVHRVIAWGIPAGFLVLGSCHIAQTDNRLLILLGAASYSIYLIQGITIPLFLKFASRFDIDAEIGVLLVAGAVLFTTVSGCALYRWFEAPVDSFLRKRYSQWNQAALQVPSSK